MSAPINVNHADTLKAKLVELEDRIKALEIQIKSKIEGK